MTSMLFTITSIGFALWVLRNTLFWVGLWQDKEYRWDRLRVHLTETVQGRKLFFSASNLIKYLLFGLYIITVFVDKTNLIFELGVFLIYFFEGVSVIKQGISHRLKRPNFTVKACILFTLPLLVISLLFVAPLTDNYLWLLILDRLTFFIISFFIFILSFPTEIYKDIQIQKAKKKMQKYPSIQVIAVSGSYGKTSTKEYIAQILNRQFLVIKTPGSTNTAIGIAKIILQKIQANTEIFVVEIGAYKKGEIAEIMDMLQPRISVTTGISDQHISLYGSVQNVLESEYELLRALPKNALSLFNKNSQFIEKLYDRARTKRLWYYTNYSSSHVKAPIYAANVQVSHKAVSFKMRFAKQSISFSTPLLGEHSVQNVLPAIYIGYHFGMTIKKLQKSVNQLMPAPQTMERKVSSHGKILIDDTFNASPESVLAAMEYVSLYKKKKIFVLSPLIELGREAKKRHIAIGVKASRTCDYLFLLNKNFVNEIKKGVVEGKGMCKVIIENALDSAKEIKEIAQKGDVIVCEGKESKIVLKKLYD